MTNLDRSAALHRRALRLLPGGVTSMVRAGFKPFPLFFDRGEGAHVWDVDGNRYLDYTLAYGPLILGHSHPVVVEALMTQASKAQTFGAQSELEPEFAELVAEAVPNCERLALGLSGTEADQLAVRIARAATGRRLVVKFEGHYHGWSDQTLYNFGRTALEPGAEWVTTPASGGMSPGAGEDVVTLPWNDVVALDTLMAERGHEIAAVMMEPVMFNAGGILPSEGYLQLARDLCTRHGAVLIFDEVITGFRLARGGAQEYFGIEADLAVFGKAIAGGLPLSCVAGKASLLREIDEGRIVQAGTLNGNPIALAAAVAVQRHLRDCEATIYPELHRIGSRLADGMAEALANTGASAVWSGVGPAFTVSFGVDRPPASYRDFAKSQPEMARRLSVALLEQGVLSIQRGMWYVSAAHTMDDVESTISAVAKCASAVSHGV